MGCKNAAIMLLLCAHNTCQFDRCAGKKAYVTEESFFLRRHTTNSSFRHTKMSDLNQVTPTLQRRATDHSYTQAFLLAICARLSNPPQPDAPKWLIHAMTPTKLRMQQELTKTSTTLADMPVKKWRTKPIAFPLIIPYTTSNDTTSVSLQTSK